MGHMKAELMRLREASSIIFSHTVRTNPPHGREANELYVSVLPAGRPARRLIGWLSVCPLYGVHGSQTDYTNVFGVYAAASGQYWGP